MAGAVARFEMNGRDSGRFIRFSGFRPSSDVDDVFGFLDYEEGMMSSDGSCSSGEWVAGEYAGGEVEVDDDDENSANAEEQKSFWHSQEQLLLATLYRTSSIETKIRHATKETLKEAQRSGTSVCSCAMPGVVAGSGCRSCLRKYVSDQLRNQGFDCAICKSKWRNSADILAGEHSFLEVIDNSNPKRRQVKVVIELNFRAEFEMARGSGDYNKLTATLPEVFVGKSDRLQTLIKILCRAAKRCMQDRNMHIGPWRKDKYMLAKWFGTYERLVQFEVPPVEFSRRQMKPVASILTFDMLGHRKVGVV